MYKKIKILIVILFFAKFTIAQVNNISFGDKEEEKPDYIFALKLIPDNMGKLTQCALIKHNSDGKLEIKNITFDSWIRQYVGFEKSEANPKRKNIPLEAGVYELPQEIINLGEEEIEKYTVSRIMSIIDNMWRLRYSKYPYNVQNPPQGAGWAKNADTTIRYMPSESQMKILSTYGVNQMNDFISGDNVTRILKDMLDKNWQGNYSQSVDEKIIIPSNK